MTDDLSFGYWVRRRRKALDLTQAELGHRVGASTAMIRKIEADERRPSRMLAELLTEHLAVPAANREAFLLAARGIDAAGALQLPGGPLATPAPPRLPASNLPAPMTSMVNRVNELAAVTAQLLTGDVRLLTLLGPPGMGKTRLSIQVAQQALPYFADGAWFVDLSTTLDSAQALPTIALTFGLPPAPGIPVERQLQMALRERHLLLVLDNLEQIVDGIAPVIAGLLRSCPRLKVLATSRVQLNIYGEHEFHVPPMSVPTAAESNDPASLLGFEAVQLFVERTRQHQPNFALSEETAAPVAEICLQMDGLPLALELAAARARRMPVEELAAALRRASGREWHALLYAADRDLSPRHRTLFNAVAWSYSLLEPTLRAVLAQMGVFVGPFDWPALAAIVDVPGLEGEPALRDALERLVDHNLVSQASRKPERWRLLELVREFARGQLDAAQLNVAGERHARYFAGALTDLLRQGTFNKNLVEDEAIADNSRAALRWALDAGDTMLAYQLSAAFEWYWEQRGLMSEGRRYLEQVLALPGTVPDGLLFDVLHGAANQAWMQHDLDVAHKHTATALVLARDRGDVARVAGFLNLQARIYLEEGSYEQADAALIEGLGIGHMHLRDLNPRFMIIQRGEAALGLGRLQEAEDLTRAGLEGVQSQDVIPFCVGWNNLAEIALAQSDLVAAREALVQIAPVVLLHSRRLRVFLVAVAGFALLDSESNSAETVVMLLSYVTEANSRLGDRLSVMTQSLLRQRIARAQQLSAPAAFQRAWDEGRRWTEEQARAAANMVLSVEL